MPLLKSSSSSLRRASSSSDKQLDTAARARPFQELSQSLALFLSTLPLPLSNHGDQAQMVFCSFTSSPCFLLCEPLFATVTAVFVAGSVANRVIVARSAGRSASCSTKRPPVTEDSARRSGKT